MKTSKNLCLILLLLGLFSCEKEDFLKDGIDNYRLKKVLNYSSTNASEPNGFITYEYTPNGQLQRESHLAYPNSLTNYNAFTYNNENQLIEKRIYNGQLGKLELSNYWEYEYEDDNLLLEKLFSANGSLKRTHNYEYQDGKLVNSYKWDDQLGIHHQYKHTFNERNLLILEEVFMYDQELSSFTKYFYDDQSRLTKTELFDHQRILTQTVEYQFIGDDLFPSEEVYFDVSGNISQRRQLLYDDFQNLVETRIITELGSNTLFIKKYDGQLLVEHIRFAPNWGFTESSMTRFEYERVD